MGLRTSPPAETIELLKAVTLVTPKIKFGRESSSRFRREIECCRNVSSNNTRNVGQGWSGKPAGPPGVTGVSWVTAASTRNPGKRG